MSREKLEYLVTPGMIAGKQREKMFDGLKSRKSDRSTESDKG